MDIHHSKKERDIKELEVTFFISYFKKFRKILFFVMNMMNPYHFMISLSTIRQTLQKFYPFVRTSDDWMFESTKI